MSHGVVDHLLDVLERLTRYHRAMRGTLVHTVADLECANNPFQLFNELVVNPFLYQDAIGADAGLAGVTVL